MTVLRAPGASLAVADHALRDLRIHGHRVLDAITVAARDDAWGTFPASLEVLSAEGGTAVLRGVHGDVFEWTGEVAVRPGEIRFALRGRVLRDVDSRRIGICLLHPLALAGLDFRTDVGSGVFGSAVDPGPPATGFRVLNLDPGCPVEIRLDGPPFEMEDHRNWSDPGWKSYCPPLSASLPLRRHAGEQLVQGVTITGRPSTVPAIHRRLVTLLEGRPLPETGSGGPVSLAGRSEDWLVSAATHLAGPGTASHVAVFDPETHTTAPGSAELVRAVLRDLGCAVPVGGGSRAHLAELNRLGAIGDWDFCTFPITAQAHHSDDSSVLATARAMPAMTATARRIAPDRPIVVTPLALRRRVGANSPAAPDDPADPRETGPLGATWLLGAMLGLRGAEAVTVLLAPGGPAAALLDRLDALRGRPFFDEPTGHPDMLAATVLGGAAPVTLVANLGTEPASVLGLEVAARGLAITTREETHGQADR